MQASVQPALCPTQVPQNGVELSLHLEYRKRMEKHDKRHKLFFGQVVESPAHCVWCIGLRVGPLEQWLAAVETVPSSMGLFAIPCRLLFDVSDYLSRTGDIRSFPDEIRGLAFRNRPLVVRVKTQPASLAGENK